MLESPASFVLCCIVPVVFGCHSQYGTEQGLIDSGRSDYFQFVVGMIFTATAANRNETNGRTQGVARMTSRDVPIA